MVNKKFNLFSLSGHRLMTEIQKAPDYSLDRWSIVELIKILHEQDIHLLSRPQIENKEAEILTYNLRTLDPIGLYYVLRSEAEYNLLEIFDNPDLVFEAEDIVETIARTEYSFVHKPYTDQEHVWDFTMGSAPFVEVKEEKTHLPKDHPKIIAASGAGLAKSMRYTY